MTLEEILGSNSSNITIKNAKPKVNVGAVMSQYNTYQADAINSPYNKEWKGLIAIENGIKSGLKGLVDVVRMGRDLHVQSALERDPNYQMNDFARSLDDVSDSDMLKTEAVASTSGIGQLGLDVAQGFGQMAPAFVASAAGSPVAGAAVMGASIAGETYDSLRDEGVDVTTAATASAINTAVQTPLEMIGLGKMFKALPVGSSLSYAARELAERVVTEGVTEFVQEYPDAITRIWAKNADKDAGEIADIVADNIGDITSDAVYSGLIGSILGGGLGGANISMQMALGDSFQRAAERGVHESKLGILERQIGNFAEQGTDADVAGAVVDASSNDARVYVDGEALTAYAQTSAELNNLALSLGVDVEAIKKAADNGSSVAISLGGFEATALKHENFFQEVKDNLSFEDGGITNANEKLRQMQAEAKKAEADKAIALEESTALALQEEQDAVLSSMLTAGVPRSQANLVMELLTARAKVMNPENPAQFLRDYALKYQQGGATGVLNQQTLPNVVKGVIEKPSKVGGKESTFFTLDSEIMDVSGHIPKDGIPFIDNLWYKEKYAKDPTDASTISTEVKGKGYAKSHVLSAISYFKEKGFDSFKIEIMSPDSHALMQRLENEGYIKAQNKWIEGGDVEYLILNDSTNSYNQIKSVDNQGTFSREDNNIYKQEDENKHQDVKKEYKRLKSIVADAKKIYHNTIGEFKAPDGTNTLLTEDEWYIAHSTEFQEYFGPWTFISEKKKLENSIKNPEIAKPGTITQSGPKGVIANVCDQVNTLGLFPVEVDTIVGKFDIVTKSIRQSLSHPPFDQKFLDAIPTLGEGMKKAAYIGNLKDLDGNEIDNFYFVYSMEYNGEKNYVFCRCRKTVGSNRLYLHKVFLQSETDLEIDKKNTSSHNLGSLLSDNERVHLRGTGLFKKILLNFLSDVKIRNQLNSNGEPHKEDVQSFIKEQLGTNEYKQTSSEKNLVAYHNTTEEKLNRALNSGGLAVPSIAITKKDIPFGRFGDITLVGTKDMVDPEKGPDVYSRDAYTTRVPTPIYHPVASKTIDAVMKDLCAIRDVDNGDRAFDRIEDAAINEPNNVLDQLDRQEVFYYYLTKVKGVEPELVLNTPKYSIPQLENEEVQKIMRRRISEKEKKAKLGKIEAERFEKQLSKYREQLANPVPGSRFRSAEAINDKIASVEKRMKETIKEQDGVYYLADETFKKYKDDYKKVEQQKKNNTDVNWYSTQAKAMEKYNSIRKGEFSEWINSIADKLRSNPELKLGNKKVPFTLDNIVKFMLQREGAGQEYIGMTPSKVAAIGAKKYKSISDIKADTGKLGTEEATKDVVAQVESKLDEAYYKAYDKHKNVRQDSFDMSEIFYEAVAKSIKGGKKATKTNVKSSLKNLDFDMAKFTDEDISTIVDAANTIKDAATWYFEAKPQRAVGINEFAGAVVPSDASPELIGKLKEAGLQVETYTREDNNARQAAVEKIQQEQDVLFQDNAQVKGSFDPTRQEGQYVISLFKGADASTVIHETGHYFVETMWQAIMDGQASQQVEKDFDTLLEYAGMTREQWAEADTSGRREAHEHLAEAFESYIMEGKAPNEQLRNAFRRFADWLKSVYKAIRRNSNSLPLTDEVRGVFDRMLAAEEDIQQEERLNGYFEHLPKVITDSMSDATKARVEAFIDKARDKAVELLTKDAMSIYKEDQKEAIKDYRAEIIPEVEKEVGELRVYKSGYTHADVKKYENLWAIVTGTDEVGRELTPEEEAWMMQADLMAESLGYSSTDEMLQDVMKAPTFKQAVTKRVSERVNEKFLDVMADIRAHEEAVRRAIYNDDAGLLIGVEQQLIEEYAEKAMDVQSEKEAAAKAKAEAGEQADENKPAPSLQSRSKEQMRERAAAYRQQARNVARADIARMTISEAVKVQKFAALERKAAMKSAAAMAKKDYREALTQKNLQAYYHAMVQESMLTKRHVEKNKAFLRRMVKAKPEAWTSEKHFAEISMLFMRMGIAGKKHDTTGRVGVSLAEYAELMNEQYDCAEFADWLLELPDSAMLTNAKEMTLGQFEDVVNAVRNIKAIARAEKGEAMFNKGEAFAELKGTIIENLSGLKTVFTPDPNHPTRAKLLDKMAASMETIDTFFQRLDGWKDGFFVNTFLARIKRSNDMEFDFKERFDNAVLAASRRWLPDKKAEAAAAQEKYYDELGTSVSKHILVKMLMNLGNKENTERLCETRPIGFEKSALWVMADESGLSRDEAVDATRTNLLEFLQNNLTAEDVRYAQDMVNAAGMFWAEKNNMEIRIKGFGMKKVEAEPAVLKINGKDVVFMGGYFPLMRNGELGSHPVSKEVGEDDPLQGRNIRTLHTNSGATKHRTRARYPVNLFPGAEMQVLYDSIHDLCWRETMNDFRRILNDSELFAMFKSKLGPARMRVFREMLEKAAQPYNSTSADLAEQTFGTALTWLRNKSANAVIMMNIKINLQNLGNIFLYGNAVEGFGYKDTISALGNYMINFSSADGYRSMTEFISSKSSFMRERMTIPDITVRDIQTDEQIKQSELEQKIMRIGSMMMAFTDGLTAKPVWMQAYSNAISNGKTEQEAIDYADMIIRRTIGSARMTDVSSLQRGGPIFKLLTMFQSFFNAQYNQWVREYGHDRMLMKHGNKHEAYERIFAFITAKFLMMSIASLTLALENPFGDDDEDGWPDLLHEMKNYGFGLLGPAGQVGSVFVGKMLGMQEFDYRMSVVQSTLEKGFKVAGTINKAATGKAEVAEGIEAVTDVAGLAIGIPQQANRLLWNLYDILFNDMSPDLSDLTRRRPKADR